MIIPILFWSMTRSPRGFLSLNRIAKTEKTTSAVSWMILIAMLAVVEPVMPRMAMSPTRAEKAQAVRI